MNAKSIFVFSLITVLFVLPFSIGGSWSKTKPTPSDRSEVVFWHFWGGEDRDVVDDVVARFNESQSEFWVRAVAMPGNNLQAKLFLSVAGGDPPDLVNQDDPVLADWGHRGVISAMEDIAPPDEVAAVRRWMLDSAERLSSYNNRLYGVCNGLDIRALYYNKTSLDQHGLKPPATIKDLDNIANTVAPPGEQNNRKRFGYLPDSRRLWAWGFVFGANFYDPDIMSASVDEQPAVDALTWMTDFSRRYGADNIASFRKGDQSLPGKTFPLLPVIDEDVVGRYTVVMDGQWRVRNIRAFQESRRKKGLQVPEFGVCPLPVPDSSHARKNAGWVNGNFFVVPKGAKNAKGAWEFAKFWIGYTDPDQAADTCAAGGWIPVSESVAQSQRFRKYLDANPLFEKFVQLAASPNQFPVPQVVGAAMFRRTVEGAAYESISNPQKDVKTILGAADREIQAHLIRSNPGAYSK